MSTESPLSGSIPLAPSREAGLSSELPFHVVAAQLEVLLDRHFSSPAATYPARIFSFQVVTSRFENQGFDATFGCLRHRAWIDSIVPPGKQQVSEKRLLDGISEIANALGNLNSQGVSVEQGAALGRFLAERWVEGHRLDPEEDWVPLSRDSLTGETVGALCRTLTLVLALRPTTWTELFKAITAAPSTDSAGCLSPSGSSVRDGVPPSAVEGVAPGDLTDHRKASTVDSPKGEFGFEGGSVYRSGQLIASSVSVDVVEVLKLICQAHPLAISTQDIANQLGHPETLGNPPRLDRLLGTKKGGYKKVPVELRRFLCEDGRNAHRWVDADCGNNRP